ncbi:hypothetical protein [Polynucleobacter sp. MWH-UH25E]|uniref:hypothetical protein n=1 Tax=Polynucleobacter sp. MWH-UH25E TaxID=1855616 RepID=UPI001BFE551B|nr:hypothetical protein [Polynucleobacter sp. MWH-UH25E]QWD61798.1 hypothetical protein ICV39_08620 [Polynucleobacter sp. MWH-UH25E]
MNVVLQMLVGPATLFRLGVVIMSSVVVSNAYADIYRCDDTPGVITLSNIQKEKNCKKMVLPPIEKRTKADASSTVAAKPGDAKASKANKNKSNYENAQGERKRIIEEELDMERDRLDAINTKIANLNTPSNKSQNKAKELASLQKKQTLHQANIELLQKELKKQ